MKMRAPLARGEIEDRTVGDMRLVKFPIRKAGKHHNLLLSHNTKTQITKLQFDKYKATVVDKALSAGDGLWPLQINHEELKLEIEAARYNSEANTFEINFNGQAYLSLPTDDNFYFPETLQEGGKLSGKILINDKTILDTHTRRNDERRNRREPPPDRKISVRDFQEKIDGVLEMSTMEKLLIDGVRYKDRDVYDSGNL